MIEARRREAKDEIVWEYQEKRYSRNLAAAMLKDLKYEEWEINLFLDNDQTGPE